MKTGCTADMLSAGEIVTCPKCGYNVKGPEQWGCFCDCGEGEKPLPDCVLDKDQEYDCDHAGRLVDAGKTKEHCQYWRKW